MENVPGSFGTSASFALRFGQIVFSSASLLFMCFDYGFYDYTAFCYLVTVMGLVTPWSMTLALFDAYSVLVKRLPPQARVLSIVVSGDFVLSFLSLGGACAVASVTELLLEAGGPFCRKKLCSRYQLSAAMAFLSWFLSFVSTIFNLWILPSAYS
ncbi:PREDICTED: CASP-like protein ARALYDRAFT_485429 [Tarenaya hassleriana]|uniref:CASP-like protein ARALYDRAFT_485429 n=1 Tax=Tarenaya hassleriana TaxID=28532 RepID=UPI00053C5FDB|nr:PREDICTED: CASP-like protein ARALYDRAFT_485429 [Tarenaya hassleriana]XP_010550398.1 PREDICTED: CASP-like protein ARALYDRAFT_485429 [Tarenaya hassleriana]